MDLSFLPALNASLNAVALALLVVGRVLARRGRIVLHRRVMISAFAVSTLFLASYVAHKVSRDFENTPFPGEGAARGLYYAVLATHVPLAATVPVFAVVLIWLGVHGRIERHRRLARVAWPIWVYVSVTGVLIYLMLYRWFPAPGPAGP